ncbi:MAG: ribosome maturation factor RimM [bacterium]|nr:ribosome maturation factor RimM [bacterium]
MSSSTSTPSGSSDQSIKIGYVRRAHGIKGAVIVRPLTDDPSRFAVGEVLATDRTEPSSVTVSTSQPHKDGLLVGFEGIRDRNQSEALRGLSFFIDPQERRDLEDDEYWPEQLVGLSMVDGEGRGLGEVVEVITGAAQDRLRVQADSEFFEVPFVAAIVSVVDVAGGVVVVDLPDGMVEPQPS